MDSGIIIVYQKGKEERPVNAIETAQAIIAKAQATLADPSAERAKGEAYVDALAASGNQVNQALAAGLDRHHSANIIAQTDFEFDRRDAFGPKGTVQDSRENRIEAADLLDAFEEEMGW